MKKRICIFSFYDEAGYVDDYIVTLLRDLSIVIDRLIIVVNGKVRNHGREIFDGFTDEVYIRENTGYDAGAYKYVLMNVLREEEMKSYDEVIFCNDTFFGPLCSWKIIFEKMENKACDFWGLSGFFHVVFAHIQSYFLVFRERIIQNGLLHSYFEENVDETTTEINDIYCQFERGLFDFLSRQAGMKYGKYISECNGDVYGYSYVYLKEHHHPVVKKKVFSLFPQYAENIWCTLSYIKYETDYDVNLILNSIGRIYGMDIGYDEILTIDHYKLPEPVEVLVPVHNDEEIEGFLEGKDFYIYGAGMYAAMAYWRFARDNRHFMGFVVSEGQCRDGQSNLYGYPILECTEVKDISEKRILLGMGTEYSNEVMKKFKDASNVLRIF